MKAANTVARSSGAVLLVKKPKMDELTPAPMPGKQTNQLKTKNINFGFSFPGKTVFCKVGKKIRYHVSLTVK